VFNLGDRFNDAALPPDRPIETFSSEVDPA
jgi:hypothetical protein